MAFAFANTPSGKLASKFALFSFVNHSFLDNGLLKIANFNPSSFFAQNGGNFRASFILKCLKFS
jgi:hypothetical protein